MKSTALTIANKVWLKSVNYAFIGKGIRSANLVTLNRTKKVFKLNISVQNTLLYVNLRNTWGGHGYGKSFRKLPRDHGLPSPPLYIGLSLIKILTVEPCYAEKTPPPKLFHHSDRIFLHLKCLAWICIKLWFLINSKLCFDDSPESQYFAHGITFAIGPAISISANLVIRICRRRVDSHNIPVVGIDRNNWNFRRIINESQLVYINDGIFSRFSIIIFLELYMGYHGGFNPQQLKTISHPWTLDSYIEWGLVFIQNYKCSYI